MEWGWGEAAARAFTGVAPVEVDIESEGFSVATPLLDLPPRAGSAYLGTFLLSLLKGLEFLEARPIHRTAGSRPYVDQPDLAPVLARGDPPVPFTGIRSKSSARL